MLEISSEGVRNIVRASDHGAYESEAIALVHLLKGVAENRFRFQDLPTLRNHPYHLQSDIAHSQESSLAFPI